ncbi:MAG: DsbA family protein [Bacteroidales bacterium]
MKRYIYITMLLLGTILLSCSPSKQKGKAYFVENRTPAALIDTIPLFLDSIDQIVRQQLYDELSRIHVIRETATKEAINNKLIDIEAKKQNLSIDSLKEKLYQGKINKENLIDFASKTNFHDVVPELRETLVFHDINSSEGVKLLTKRYKRHLIDQFVDSLRGIHNIEILLSPPPPPPKITLKDLIIHTKGSSDAKINVLIVSDFDCYSCREQNVAFDELYKKYADKVKLSFSYYSSYVPITAVASECAANQDKFWVMHDSIFSTSAIPDSVALFRMADNIGLDMERFEKDFLDENIKTNIRESMLRIESAGIYGTPTVLINDHLIFNSTSIEDIEKLLKEKIDENY